MNKTFALFVITLLVIEFSSVILADNIFLYKVTTTEVYYKNPITFYAINFPCKDSPKYSVGIYNSSSKVVGYAFTLQNTSYYFLQYPALIFNISTTGYYGTYSPSNGFHTSAEVSPQAYSVISVYYIVNRIASPTVIFRYFFFSPLSYYPGVKFLYVWNTTLLPVSSNVLNLVDGNSYQTSLVYQGDNDGTSTNSYPADLSGSSAIGYWNNWYTNAAIQPVLLLTPDNTYAPEAGAIFWSYSYTKGKNISISVIATETSNVSGYIGHGITVYMFIKPKGWAVSSKYNFSVNYESSENLAQPPSPVMGDVIFPDSSANYLAVQFDPAWFYNYSSATGGSVPGTTGPWNVWVVSSNLRGFNPSPSPNLGSPYSGWDGVGTAPFPWIQSQGNYVLICVKYNPSVNTIYAYAEDLYFPFNSSSLTLNLGRYFSAPASGTYAFGINAGTGNTYDANWSIVFANVSS